MKILVIAEPVRYEECRRKLGDHEYTQLDGHAGAEQLVAAHDLAIDFLIDENPGALRLYAQNPSVVLLNTCRISLAALAASSGTGKQCKLFGFNGLPTQFDREALEVSLLDPRDLAILEKVCHDLGTSYLLVNDRVGMVTPRVICMIINEAYYTVQEGTATKEDIDLAMKLGTNYPYGPFEWCQRIGLQNVYRLLEAVYEDTRDERYKIAPLMKKEYMRNR